MLFENSCAFQGIVHSNFRIPRFRLRPLAVAHPQFVVDRLCCFAADLLDPHPDYPGFVADLRSVLDRDLVGPRFGPVRLPADPPPVILLAAPCPALVLAPASS